MTFKIPKYSRMFHYFVCKTCDTVIRVPVNKTSELEITCPICGNIAPCNVIATQDRYANLLLQGYSPKEIAKKLKVKETTVRDNMLRLYAMGNNVNLDSFIHHPEYKEDIYNYLANFKTKPFLRVIKDRFPYCDWDTIAVYVTMYYRDYQ